MRQVETKYYRLEIIYILTVFIYVYSNEKVRKYFVSN